MRLPWFIVPVHAKRLECSDADIDIYKYILTREDDPVSYIIKRNNCHKARVKSRSLRVIAGDLCCRTATLTTVMSNLKKDLIYPQYDSIWAMRVQDFLKTQINLLKEIIEDGISKEGINIPLDLSEIKALHEKLSKWDGGWLSNLQAILRKCDIEITPCPPFIKIKSKTPKK